MRYREAVHEDTQSIAVLHAESWRNTYRGAYRNEYLDGNVQEERMGVWEKRLSVPPANQLVVIAEDAGRVVGFVCAYGRDDERWGTLLDNLHVGRERHRQGTGTRLVSEVAAWCRANYADCGLYLWALTQNIAACRFYERLGATARGVEVSVPPGGGLVSSHRYVWTASELPALAADSVSAR